MELEAEVPQAVVLQTTMDDIKSGHLFRDEEDRFAIVGSRRDDVSDSLTLPGSRGPLDDKIPTLPHRFDDEGLGRVSVDDLDQILRGEKLVELLVFREDAGLFRKA